MLVLLDTNILLRLAVPVHPMHLPVGLIGGVNQSHSFLINTHPSPAATG
jgi:hypothetical protein